MNAAMASALDAIPIPVENGQPVQACVMNDADGNWRTMWMHEGGRRKELFGPPYSLANALAAAGHLNQRVWAQ